ncbi:MAG: zinc-ribbon domain-containing protein [Phycisphaerales bacterium]
MSADEGPSEHDLQSFGGVTRPCPSCGKEIIDDAELCAHCGTAIEGTAQGSGPGYANWVVVTSVALVIGFGVLLLFRR